ncbi:hypothetical protein LAZ67_4001748 [Cordylochernes scorpioides]|uniref:Uncharacterized protein n=1 Tax=Cordylochernes scorpioides TaxID=51811 RepID=A0ABY6KCG7_9ARAC|nr:hypothetical protein LAZ67_4001748 [Cordylochernes scorpioides]
MSSGTAVPTTRGPMGRLSIIPGHQGGEGFAESGRRGELTSLIRINSVLGLLTISPFPLPTKERQRCENKARGNVPDTRRSTT